MTTNPPHPAPFPSGVPGELPDARPDAAVRARALDGEPVDAGERGLGDQQPAGRHLLPAQVHRLQPGGHHQGHPLHQALGGVHRPQVSQVRASPAVGNLRVGTLDYFVVFVFRFYFWFVLFSFVCLVFLFVFFLI